MAINTVPSTKNQPRSAAAIRQARLRARRKAAAQSAPLLYERADWQLFTQPHSLPQQAGCTPDQLGRIMLKELVDNALDSGGEADLSYDGHTYRIADTGPGIDPDLIPSLFAINRPLLSSKLKRLPLRGMLGNGWRVVMGAVAAHGGTISVASRGERLILAVDKATGLTTVIERTPEPGATIGTVVEITLSIFNGTEHGFARTSLAVAHTGETYSGPSDPAWYDAAGFAELFARVSPPDTTAAALIKDVFGVDIDAPKAARRLDAAGVEALHKYLLSATPRVSAERIGHIGPEVFSGETHSYHWAIGVARIDDARVPYIAEAWVACRHADKGDRTNGSLGFLLNRSPTITPLFYDSDSVGLYLEGCGYEQHIASAKRGKYELTLSLITPFVRLINDGKTRIWATFTTASRRPYRRRRAPLTAR